jgi:hypothetical protein
MGVYVVTASRPSSKILPARFFRFESAPPAGAAFLLVFFIGLIIG